MFNRKGLAALMCLVGILAGAACQSRLEPSPIESSAASPSKTSSPHQTPSATSEPTPEPPSMPAEALKPTDSGAKAFIRHYFRVLNYCDDIQDWHFLEKLNDSNCKGCTDLVQQQGRYVNGGEWVVRGIEVARVPRSDTALVTVGGRVTAGHWVPAEDAPPTPIAEQRWLMDFRLIRRGTEWRVLELRAAG